jgi:hypothetical protein
MRQVKLGNLPCLASSESCRGTSITHLVGDTVWAALLLGITAVQDVLARVLAHHELGGRAQVFHLSPDSDDQVHWVHDIKGAEGLVDGQGHPHAVRAVLKGCPVIEGSAGHDKQDDQL